MEDNTNFSVISRLNADPYGTDINYLAIMGCIGNDPICTVLVISAGIRVYLVFKLTDYHAQISDYVPFQGPSRSILSEYLGIMFVVHIVIF